MNKNSKTQLIVIIGILVIINISVLIINGYKGESIFKDTFIYVIVYWQQFGNKRG